MAKTKLKDLLSEVFEDVKPVDKHQVIEGVRSYGIVGKALYNGGNIMELAEQLAGIAEQAHHHILGENDDWFDQISVNKNMKALKGNVMEFQKTAKEAHALNQRLTGLYEDIGHVLNRYYEIDEIMEDAGDMDGDGLKEPDDEEYMDNKDAAIKSAMKNERLGDPDGRDPVSRPEGAKRDARDHEAKNENVDWDKAPAKDGNNSRDQYADSDGDEMKEQIGAPAGDDPDKQANDDDDPDNEGRAAQKEGTIRLKDIVNGIVGIKPVGTTIVKK